MEEELNENELEERFYSMLHYVDDTQANVTTNHDALKIIENAPRSTVRRYWRTSGDHGPPAPFNTPFQKINIPKEASKPLTDEPKPKQEKNNLVAEPFPNHLSLFNSPVPKDVKNSVEILENDYTNVVELESSDEDEVIEVALPPKPTITIESSDEEIPVHDTPTKAKKRHVAQGKNSPNDREISASPVPSIVSSVSDEFIRGDCIAFNISSHRPDNPSFDFSLHGSDILGSAPSKKKKKKKNKESVISTPITVGSAQNKSNVEGCFATPKNKAKNKKQKNKSYIVTEKSVPNADVYDSDSNQSIVEINKNQHSYIVNEKSLPCVDVYETKPTENPKPKSNTTSHIDVDTSGSSVSLDKCHEETPKSRKDALQLTGVTINLTEDDEADIQESIVIGNVTGFTGSDDYGKEAITAEPTTVSKLGSTRVPAILYENLDFDNLKGKEKVCKNRRYSLTTLRAEMEKFYNESWGGEDFNHREIQKSMSRDKSLWAIDPKDRMGTFGRKKYNNNVTCNYCNRTGHRDDTCRLKPPVCFMCGSAGHMEPRCPSKICVNCGSPNHMYSTMCGNCSTWGRVRCAECGQFGHPQSHCPDLWRRYHNTIDFTPYLQENHFTKKHYQLFCSGCTRRGHLVHTCRLSLPFSGLPINSPYVSLYAPVYLPRPDRRSQDCTISSATTAPCRAKRPSKSPVAETHVNKKRNVSLTEVEKSPNRSESQRKTSQSKEESNLTLTDSQKSDGVEQAPDFIPIVSNNHDKKGQVIQDNEVSDTSGVITSARIYVTPDIIDKFKTEDGVKWLNDTSKELQVAVETDDDKSFLNIKGKLYDQEAFQSALRDWAKDKFEHDKSENEGVTESTNKRGKKVKGSGCGLLYNDIPKGKSEAMRHLKKALESLDNNYGEPNALYKELNFQQNRHRSLLNQKIVSTQQLDNTRSKIKAVCKKLNIVLLGQAGLAGGAAHVRALFDIHRQLVNHRAKVISDPMHQNIGKHFHTIFTNVPRNDYGELLLGYNARHYPLYKKQKKQLKFNSKLKNFDTIPGQKDAQNQRANEVKTIQNQADNSQSRIPNNKKVLAQKTRNKLVGFRRRLERARPNDSVLKKTRVALMRKLCQYINSLGENKSTSSKNLKKIKRVQEQAQLFLNNV